MRIRLLIDVTLNDEDIPTLAELIARQPPTGVDIQGWDGHMMGRFMGAQPIHVETVNDKTQ